MKSLLFLAASIFLLHWQSDAYRVKGEYKVILDEEFAADTSNTNYIITFGDSTYVKSFKNGERVKGKIKRMSKYDRDSKTVYLEDFVENTHHNYFEPFGDTRIEFKETRSDTLKFRTTFVENLHLTENEGRLIKIR